LEELGAGRREITESSEQEGFDLKIIALNSALVIG